MSAQDASSFLQRAEDDQGFAAALHALRNDPAAAQALVRAEGFDVTAEEVRDAFMERYKDRLTLEQLDKIASGANGYNPWDPADYGFFTS